MANAELVMSQSGARPRPEQPADDELLAAYRNGDEAAAALLFERYYGRLLKLAREKMEGRLLDLEESSDVAQSVFHSLFSRDRTCQISIGPRGSLWPLLVTITMNKIYSRARYWGRQRRDRRREVPLAGRDPLESGPSPEDAAKLQEVIDELLQPFSPRRRQTIEYLLQDLPVDEIARLVGASKRTVYRTRETALQILKQLLARS